MVTNNTLDGVNDSVQLCSRSLNIARNSYSTLVHETLSEIQNVAFIEDISNIKKKNIYIYIYIYIYYTYIIYTYII